MDLLGVATLGVGGFALGTILGLALRAFTKVIMYAIGLYLLSLVVLSSVGLIIVNWAGVEATLSKVISWLIALTQTDIFTSTGVLGISGFVGTLYGLTRGTVVNTQEEYRFFRKLE
jgi:FUN14 family.